MRPSLTLHQLLHSLTQAEKRYLRLYAGRPIKGSHNQSAWLMDAVWDQETYDEAAIKTNWDAAGYEIKQFAFAKNYLMRLTLQAMRDFHRSGNARRVIADVLMDAEFLHARGIAEEAKKLVQKAKNEALKAEFPDLVIQADTLLRGMALRKFSESTLGELEALELSSNNALALLEAILFTSISNIEATARARQFLIVRDQSALTEIESLEAIVKNIESRFPQHFTPRLHSLRTQAALAQLKGDVQGVWDANYAVLNHWLAFPKMQEILSGPYLVTLINNLHGCLVNDRYAEMEELLDLLSVVSPKTELEKTEIAQNLAYYQLIHAMNTQAWNLVGPLTNDLQAIALAQGTKIPKARLTAIQYNVAIAYFFLEDHKKALQAFNNILNDKQSQHREDLQQAARLLQAVVHYELGNHDLLEYLLRSLKRYLQTKGGLHAFEATLVKTLRDLLAKPHLQTETLQDLKEKLEFLQNDPANAHAPGLEEMQHWVNAKLRGRPIREMLGRIDN